MEFLCSRTPGTDGSRPRYCVIVCGLHRSGTSAVTRVINLLGADIAPDLLSATSFNSRGYWESSAVLTIHERVLRAVSEAQEHSLDPTVELPDDWLRTNAAREAKRQLIKIVQRDYAGSRIFVVKDPRFWRLLPLWVELLEELGVAPIVVVPFRNPMEVAASLAQRDRLPLQKALLLYFCTYLETERTTRQIPRVFVRYDRLLQNWRPFAQRLEQGVGTELSAPSDGDVREIERFLTPDLYHHRFNREQMVQNSDVPAAVIEMFDSMTEAAETGDESKIPSAFDHLGLVADMARFYHGYAISELQSLRQELVRVRESFEESTSWRVTAPLRRLKLRVLSKPRSHR